MLWHQNSGAKPLPLNSGAMAFLVPNSILLTWHHFWSLARVQQPRSLGSPWLLDSCQAMAPKWPTAHDSMARAK
ncbi:hypothetical protein Tco_1567449, partial [Tanacetum coccineum]